MHQCCVEDWQAEDKAKDKARQSRSRPRPSSRNTTLPCTHPHTYIHTYLQTHTQKNLFWSWTSSKWTLWLECVSEDVMAPPWRVTRFGLPGQGHLSWLRVATWGSNAIALALLRCQVWSPSCILRCLKPRCSIYSLSLKVVIPSQRCPNISSDVVVYPINCLLTAAFIQYSVNSWRKC